MGGSTEKDLSLDQTFLKHAESLIETKRSSNWSFLFLPIKDNEQITRVIKGFEICADFWFRVFVAFDKGLGLIQKPSLPTHQNENEERRDKLLNLGHSVGLLPNDIIQSFERSSNILQTKLAYSTKAAKKMFWWKVLNLQMKFNDVEFKFKT